MSSLHEQWEKIDTRLKKLDVLDQESESEILAEAYENLILAYQEARELNDEMNAVKQNFIKVA